MEPKFIFELIKRIDNKRSFLSQSQHPRMALISVSLLDKEIIFTAPGMENLRISSNETVSESIRGQIWKDNCLAVTYGNKANNWFGEFLSVDCQLVYMPNSSLRLDLFFTSFSSIP